MTHLEELQVQSFCWLFWELLPNLNWEILSSKYESEINLGITTNKITLQ
jgi:hypothetical protein